MAVTKHHGDGSGSFSFNSFTLDYTSWRQDPNRVFSDASKKMEERMADIPGDKIQITAFNRI